MKGVLSQGAGDHPQDGDKYSVGSVETIGWETAGLISNVKIAYSLDNFVSRKFLYYNAAQSRLEKDPANPANFAAAQSIPNTVNGSQSYDWLIPDDIKAVVKMRIYDANDESVQLQPPGSFKIHALIYDLTPGIAANEVYQAGQAAVNFSWQSLGTVPRVKLEYTLNDGGDWYPVTAAQSMGVTDNNGIITSNPGSISWTLPNEKSGNLFQAYVRVTWLDATNVPDTDAIGVSANPFKVTARVTVLSPDGENNPFWKVGETDHNITWTTSPADLGGGNTVDILFATNGKNGDYNPVTNGDDTANDGIFNWNPIPDAISGNVYVKVVDSTDSDTFGVSEDFFSIAGDLKIEAVNNDAPLGGESWPVYAATPPALAQVQQIKWTSFGSAMTLVDIHASSDGFQGSDVELVAGYANAVGQNTFNWQISDSVAPITVIKNNWQIKIINTTPSTPAEEITSDTFDIQSGLYMATGNVATDVCVIGQSCTIDWSTAGSVDDVILEYSTNGPSGPWTKMHGGGTLGGNPGTYDWPVPGSLTPGSSVRYRVSDAEVGHPISEDPSDTNSKLIASFPSGDIELNSTGQVINGQTFAVSETVLIDYTYNGVVGAIDVELTLDEDNDPATFDDPQGILNSVPTNGDGTGQFSYQFTNWLAEGKDVTRMQFRILDTAVPDNAPSNVTNGVSGTFKLRGTIIVTSPTNGTERWPVGSQQTITWSHMGDSIYNVMIEYDDNAGFTSPTTIIGSTASNEGIGGSFQITVNAATFPEIDSLIHNDIFVRISDADTTIHGASEDVSNNGHLIIGVLDYTQASHSPITGDAWELLSPHTITWYTVGNITNVNIYYSHTGNIADGVLINDQITSGECPGGGAACTNSPDDDTSVSWTPPVNLTLSTTAKIWIEDADDNTTPQAPTYKVRKESPTFELYGMLTLTEPLLDDQKLKATNTVNFTWDTVGDTLNSVDIQYSRDNDSNLLTFDDPQPIKMGHDNSVAGGQRGTYTWTIPSTFNDETVYVRVRPTGSTNGFDVSGSFKIMPKISITTPSGGEGWEIGIPEYIVWDIKGVVSQIELRYSTDDGGSYPDGAPYEIVTLNPNGGGYALSGANARHLWQDAATGGVADTRTTLAKIMLQNLDDLSGDSDAESAGNFSIQARFVLKAPTVNQQFIVGSNFNLVWDWGGTIPKVVLEYSDSYDGSDPATFDAGAKCMRDPSAADCTVDIPEDLGPPYVPGVYVLVNNGAGASGMNYSPPAITVPDDISRPGDPNGEFPYYVRISDPTDPNVFDIFPDGAGNGFKIKGDFEITAPDGGEDLFVGNLSHAISWGTTGTIEDVVLEYTKDNWTTPLCVAGGTYPNCNSIPNTSPYSWQIADDDQLIPYACNSIPDPDPEDLNHPCKIQTTKVRVRDADDLNVLNASDGNFTARYTAKRWWLRDATTGSELDSITMYENTIHKIRAFGGQNVTGVVSPYSIWSPANIPYTIAFAKTGYTDIYDPTQLSTSTDKLTGAGEEMVDEEQVVFLDSIIAHNDVINTDYKYTAATGGGQDKIAFTVWYTRDGLNVTTTQSAHLRVFDGAAQIFDVVSNVQEPAGSGVYIFEINNTGLQTGKDYEARNRITLTSGAQLEGYSIINITGQSQVQTASAEAKAIVPIVATNLDRTLSIEFDDAKGRADSAKQTISDAIGDTGGKTLSELMDDQTVIIEDAIDEFQEKSDDAIFRMQDEITKAGIRLIIPDTTKIGTTETLRVGTETGVSPSIDMYCPDGNIAVAGIGLTETGDGIYAADVKFDNVTFKCATAKAVTVIASALIPSKDPNDPAVLATAIGSIFLTTTDLDTIQGLAAAGLNAEKAAKDAKDAIEGVAQALQGDGDIFDALGALQQSVNRLPMLLGDQRAGVTAMQSTLDTITGRLDQFIGNEGYDLRSILRQEIGEGVKGVRNVADRTMAATEIMKEIMERKVGKSDEPIVQTFYEIGSVKLRVVAVNPSTEKSQIVPIKIYLPKEVIPDDIIEMGDLQAGYDSAKGLYYAYHDGVELAPQETRVFEVHLEDVWKIPEEQLDKTRNQLTRALDRLKDTEYFAQAKVMVDSVERRMNEIIVKQNDQTISREEHIGAYRINMLMMDQIKNDVEVIEKMLQHTGAPPSIEFLQDTVFEEKDDLKKGLAWKIILGITAFIGLLGVGFYLRWFLLLRSKQGQSTEEVMDAAPSIEEHIGENEGSTQKEEPDNPETS
ncbi:MAG: hypothetical protein JW893_02240 [Candidatus Omnitrophica bacterium]|nr:hypothetical protein [Candidatus Omnitrophota bacterium]